MKKLLSTIVSSLIVFSSVWSPAFALSSMEINRLCVGAFPDTPSNNSLCSYVEYLYSQGVVSGYSDGGFHPDDLVTRGQFSKMVVNAFQLSMGSTNTDFPDVTSTNKFYTEINTLKSLGIINGFSDGNFKPEEKVTRGAAMKFIVNSAVQKNSTLFPETTTLASAVFPDVANTHAFASYIARAYSVDDPSIIETVIGGYSDGTFRPDLNMTRAQVAKVLTNSMKYGQLQPQSCSLYFCQDKYKNSDGTITGQYFDLTYDPSFWLMEYSDISAANLGTGDLGAAVGSQYSGLLSINNGYSSIFFSAMDLGAPKDLPDMTYEKVFELLSQGANKSTNQYYGEIVVESMKQNPSAFGGGQMEVLSVENSSNGDYLVKVHISGMSTDGVTFSGVGYISLRLTGNVVYTHVGVCENEGNLDNLKNTLNNVSYK